MSRLLFILTAGLSLLAASAAAADDRVHITRTKDFHNWSDVKVFFDPGFASIVGVLRRDEANQRWAMVIKCSRDVTLKTMPGRNLWLPFTGLDLDHPDFSPLEGPIAGNHSPMFSNPESRKSMAEGPSLLHHQGRWLLAWDEPAGGGMQLASSPNFAAKSADGAKLVLRVVNPTVAARAARFDIQGVTLQESPSRVTTLAHDDLMAFNTLSQPEQIKSATSEWQLESQPVSRSFAPNSFTVIETPSRLRQARSELVPQCHSNERDRYVSLKFRPFEHPIML